MARKIEQGKPLTDLVKGSMEYTLHTIRRAFFAQYARDFDDWFEVVDTFADHIIVMHDSLPVDEYYLVTYTYENARFVFAERADWEIVELSYIPKVEAVYRRDGWSSAIEQLTTVNADQRFYLGRQLTTLKPKSLLEASRAVDQLLGQAAAVPDRDQNEAAPPAQLTRPKNVSHRKYDFMKRWEISYDWHIQAGRRWGYQLSELTTVALGETLHRLSIKNYADLNKVKGLIGEVVVVESGSLPDGVTSDLRPAGDGRYDVLVDELPFGIRVSQDHGHQALMGTIALQLARAFCGHVPTTDAAPDAGNPHQLADRRKQAAAEIDRRAISWGFRIELNELDQFRATLTDRLARKAASDQTVAEFQRQLFERQPVVSDGGVYLQFGKVWGWGFSPVMAQALERVLVQIGDREPRDLARLKDRISAIRPGVTGVPGQVAAAIPQPDAPGTYVVLIGESAITQSFADESTQRAALRGIIAHEFGHIIEQHGPQNEAEHAQDVAAYRADPRGTARRLDGQEVEADYAAHRWGFGTELAFIRNLRIRPEPAPKLI